MANVRNLIIGYDGTCNDTKDAAKTNVYKLLTACTVKDQIQHYEEGVGTAHWEALPGGIYGEGIERQILGAYRFLVKRFADTGWSRKETKVYIFGFSRGAYAARRLAGLITHCGVPRDDSDVNLAWQLYVRRDTLSIKELNKNARLFDIEVEMLGVWDTVKTTTDDDFNDHDLPKCVVAGYHAMAIDEKRNFFPVLKWNAEERVTQMWFPGVHSDVGGGYPECGLSDIALQWMIDRASEHGLKFKAKSVKELKKDPCGMLHDSYQGIWVPFGASIRPIDTSEMVHICTKERVEKMPDYKPTNLPAGPNYKS